jgi:hypothetical protein
LTVIVTDSDGRPRSGVRLEIQSSGAAVSRATSAIDLGTAGRTDLRGCSPGRVTLDLSVGDLHRVVAANVVAGEASEVTVRMAVEKGAAVEGTGSVGDGVVAGEAPPEVAARKDHAGSGVIRGRILEHGTGKPMSGVAVQISGAEVVTTTDDDGNFRLEAVDPGPQQLTLSKDGFELRTVDTSVVAGKDIVVDETLQPATTLRLTLRRRDGSAYVGRARLILGHYTSTGTIGTSDDITFDKDGSAVFRQILPGLYRVVVIVDHVGQARVLEVKIPLGATTLDLVLQ